MTDEVKAKLTVEERAEYDKLVDAYKVAVVYLSRAQGGHQVGAKASVDLCADKIDNWLDAHCLSEAEL